MHYIGFTFVQQVTYELLTINHIRNSVFYTSCTVYIFPYCETWRYNEFTLKQSMNQSFVGVKNMKKTAALLLVCTLLTGLFSGCASKTEDVKSTETETAVTTEQTATTETATTETTDANEPVALSMAWWGNQTRNERTQAALDLYTAQNPNVTFDGQFAEWADYWNKLATASAGHSLQDIIQMDYKYLQQYVSNDLLVDLTPYIESGVIDTSSVGPNIIQSGSIDEGVYALCIGINAPSLLYNKTLLDENGITIKDNMTMDEFKAVSREVFEKTGYKTNVAYNNGDNFIEYFMRGKGVRLFEDGRLGAAAAEDFVDFFNIYETGIAEGWHVEPSIFAERTIGSVEQDPLVFGSSPETMSWCAFAYSNQLTATQAAAGEGVEIGITTWPSDDPKLSNYLKPGQFLSISVDSKNPEEAAKVLNYWTNAVDCNEILLGERGVPASSEVATAIGPKMDEISNKVITYINDVVTPNSSRINPPASDNANQVFDLIDQLEEQLCYGQIDSAEAAKQLFEQGNEMMK